MPHIYESSRGQRRVGAANIGLEKIDVWKIQIRPIPTTRRGVGSSPVYGQVFKERHFTGRPTSGRRSDLRLSQVLPSVAPMLGPFPHISRSRRVTDGNGARDFFAATLYEAIPQAFVALDAESRFIYVNAKAGAILGREPSSLLGRNVWDEFPDARERPFATAYEQVKATKTASHRRRLLRAVGVRLHEPPVSVRRRRAGGLRGGGVGRPAEDAWRGAVAISARGARHDAGMHQGHSDATERCWT